MFFTTLISLTELHSRLGEVNLIDMRFTLADPDHGERAYQHSHLPGAQYAHLDHDLCGPVVPGLTGRHPLPEVSQFVQHLRRWGIGNESQVVVYDDANGAYAARLWWMLNWVGHSQVAVLDGGWQAWTGRSLPVTDVVEPRPQSAFEPHMRPGLLASTAEVDALRSQPDARILDARLPVRYRGEQEPIDPVAGHIPGVLNAPHVAALLPNGTFLDPENLRQHFQPLLGAVPASRTIHYCGSGVTSASNILAMAHAGLGMSRLYAGSWSEWIADPNRPIAAS